MYIWYELRYARITASKAYEAAHCKVMGGALTEAITRASKLKDTDAMKRGRLLESEVKSELEKYKDKQMWNYIGSTTFHSTLHYDY